MEGIVIDDIVLRGEAASDKFFRILRFFAPTVCAIHREKGRVVVRSLVLSFVRSLAARRTTDPPTDGCAVLPRLRIDMHCLSSFYSLSFSRRFSTPVRLCRARRFSLRRSFAVRTPSMRRRFYLIALLCFIEQLLRSRAVCFFSLLFTITTGNSCARDFSV